MYLKLIAGNNKMFSKKGILVFRDADGDSKWFKFLNIKMWIHKFWKPSIIGMYVGKYEGGWKDGLEHGHGIRTSSNGGWKFIGKWKNGKYFHGTYFFANGDKHFGFFKYGLADGHGIRTYSDGRKYSGEFKCARYHGQGTYYSSSGGKLVGRFHEGIPWFTTDFDKDQNFIGLHVRGVEREIIPLKPKY
jgi:hypothetical protein